MIEMYEALSWLNCFGDTNLSLPVRSLVEIIDDPRTTEENLKGTCAHAHSMSEYSHNPFERSEVLLHCGAAYYRRDFALEAVRLIRDAYMTYDPDDHYRAVAAWMLGISAAAASDFILGYHAWDEARCIYTRLAEQNLTLHRPVERSWYLDRLKEMNRDLACLPREAFTWLNRFEPTNLSPRNQEIKKMLINSIAKRQVLRTYEIIRDLQLLCRNSSDYREPPEILLECGLQFFLLGNVFDAVDLIRQSVASFPPQSHRQAVARWMLGAVQWYSRDLRRDALLNWEQSIDSFKNLALKADYEDKQTQKDWYLKLCEVLELAAQERIQENFS